MLKHNIQLKMSFYRDLYDIIIPKDHILSKIKENIDFSFINPVLKESYCEHYGRPAKEPEMMFKLLFLKKLYDLSDEKLIESARVNMAYKYFLNLDPEDEIINSSLLTKFRKTRITDEILEEMLKETIRQAIEKGLIKSTAIIVDATHVNANAKAEPPTKILRKMTKELRLKIYKERYDISSKLPDKPSETCELSEEIEYTSQLLESIGSDIKNSGSKRMVKLYDKIELLLEDENIRKIRSYSDIDARFGHKSEHKAFFGYKTHIAMTEERLISGIEVTSGEASDDKIMRKITEQSEDSGIKIEEIIGDTAYSARENIKYCNGKDIKLVSPLNPVISAASTPKNDGFVYNKDAGTLQCPAGYLAISFRKNKGKYDNIVHTYHFSKVKCKACPLNGSCRVYRTKTKTYSLTITSNLHKAQIEFQNSKYFKQRMKIRKQIESKNAELKHAHGLDRCDSTGITTARLQSYLTAFVVNVKRIVKLNETVYA